MKPIINVVALGMGVALAVSAAEGAPAGGEERFYGQEQFTIVYAHTGQQIGMSTEHVREWGRRRAEITDTRMSFAGVSQRTNTRAVFEGSRIATTNLDTQAVTTSTNPFYEPIVAGLRGRDAVEVGRTMMTAMGGRSTGERSTFGGLECEHYEIPRLGARQCVTSWGATLHLRTSLAGITMEKTATQVRMGDGGPDASFVYDASKATQVPNIQDIMNKMKGK
jgi:hypothetical protein